MFSRGWIEYLANKFEPLIIGFELFQTASVSNIFTEITLIRFSLTNNELNLIVGLELFQIANVSNVFYITVI